MPTWSSSGKQPALGVYCLVVCTAVLLTLAAQTGHAFAVYRPYDDTNSLAERERTDPTRPVARDSRDLSLVTALCIRTQCQGAAGFLLNLCLVQCLQQRLPQAESRGLERGLERRQVDPMTSCIEANCHNGWGDYWQCVVDSCLPSPRKRDADKTGYGPGSLPSAGAGEVGVGVAPARQEGLTWGDSKVPGSPSSCQKRCTDFGTNLQNLNCMARCLQ